MGCTALQGLSNDEGKEQTWCRVVSARTTEEKEQGLTSLVDPT